MNYAKIISIILALVAIIWACLPGTVFYPGGFGISDRTKPIPRWLGRLSFIAFGLLMLYFGLASAPSLLIEKVIAVGFGTAVIVNGFAAKKLGARATTIFGNSTAPPVPKRFGGLLPLIVGILFILIGLGLKR